LDFSTPQHHPRTEDLSSDLQHHPRTEEAKEVNAAQWAAARNHLGRILISPVAALFLIYLKKQKRKKKNRPFETQVSSKRVVRLCIYIYIYIYIYLYITWVGHKSQVSKRT
jgi:hypothetical protein